MHFRSWSSAVAVTVVAVALGGWYVRPIAQARVIGVEWRRTLQRTHCTWTWSELNCTTNWPPVSDATEYVTVQLTAITRGIIRVNRVSAFPDSAHWLRTIDSTRHVMAARQREALSCDTAETNFPIAEAWRVGAHEVRLYAAPLPATTLHGPSWYSSIQLVPRGAAGCGRTLEYRMPTLAQFARAVRAWLTDRLGF